MKTLKAIALSTAATMALVPTVSSAQVVELGVIDLISAITTTVENKVVSSSLNLANIDGSVNIAAGGANGGNTSNTDNTLTVTEAAIDQTITGAINGAVAEWSTAGTGTSDIDSPLVQAGGANGGSGSYGFNLDLTLTDTDTGLYTQAATIDTETVIATLTEVGNIDATALGAVTSGALMMTETAGSIASTSASETASTAASAGFDSDIGSGTAMISSAANLGSINASVNSAVTGGSTKIGNIGTTAAGSINSSAITASVVGVNPSVTIIP
jgi:hypothetical protein